MCILSGRDMVRKVSAIYQAKKKVKSVWTQRKQNNEQAPLPSCIYSVALYKEACPPESADNSASVTPGSNTRNHRDQRTLKYLRTLADIILKMQLTN